MILNESKKSGELVTSVKGMPARGLLTNPGSQTKIGVSGVKDEECPINK